MKLLIFHYRASVYGALIREQSTGKIPDLEILTARNRSELPASLEDIDAILAWRVPKLVIQKAANIRWLASTGAGVDHLMAPGLAKEVTITKAAPIFGKSIAEYVLGYVLAVSLCTREVFANMERKRWAVPPRSELSGKLVGILGFGTIGREVARALTFWDMRIWAMKRETDGSLEAERVFGKGELEGFLPPLDFLVLTLPLTDETRGMIGARELSILKPSCRMINVSRGRIVNEQDVAEALRAGRLAGYVSDVFSEEPLSPESPLWTLPNVIVTPHYGAITSPAEFVPSFVENLGRFARGEPLLFQIDREKGY